MEPVTLFCLLSHDARGGEPLDGGAGVSPAFFSLAAAGGELANNNVYIGLKIVVATLKGCR